MFNSSTLFTFRYTVLCEFNKAHRYFINHFNRDILYGSFVTKALLSHWVDDSKNFGTRCAWVVLCRAPRLSGYLLLILVRFGSVVATKSSETRPSPASTRLSSIKNTSFVIRTHNPILDLIQAEQSAASVLCSWGPNKYADPTVSVFVLSKDSVPSLFTMMSTALCKHKWCSSLARLRDTAGFGRQSQDNSFVNI